MEYLNAFLIGGGVIAGSKLVSKMFNPAIGSIVAGMPTGIIASYFISGAMKKKEFFRGYAVHAPLLALTIITIALMTSYTSYNINIVATVGLVLWLSLAYYIITSYPQLMK
jgi:hypothetical protein